MSVVWLDPLPFEEFKETYPTAAYVIETAIVKDNGSALPTAIPAKMCNLAAAAEYTLVGLKHSGELEIFFTKRYRAIKQLTTRLGPHGQDVADFFKHLYSSKFYLSV